MLWRQLNVSTNPHFPSFWIHSSCLTSCLWLTFLLRIYSTETPGSKQHNLSPREHKSRPWAEQFVVFILSFSHHPHEGLSSGKTTMSESLIGSYWAFPISGCGFRRKKLSYKLIFAFWVIEEETTLKYTYSFCSPGLTHYSEIIKLLCCLFLLLCGWLVREENYEIMCSHKALTF